MKNFTNKVKNRIAYRLSAVVMLLPISVFALIKYIEADGIIGGTPMSDFIGGFFNGVRGATALGFVVYLLVMAIHDILALKNEEKLKALEIAENDERMILIKEVSSKTAFNICLFLIMIACIISGLFNSVISMTLLITWVAIVIIWFVAFGVYEKKM